MRDQAQKEMSVPDKEELLKSGSHVSDQGVHANDVLKMLTQQKKEALSASETQ